MEFPQSLTPNRISLFCISVRKSQEGSSTRCGVIGKAVRKPSQGDVPEQTGDWAASSTYYKKLPPVLSATTLSEAGV